VLTEAFEEVATPVRHHFQKGEAQESEDHSTERDYSIEEKQAIAKRLRDLGYID